MKSSNKNDRSYGAILALVVLSTAALGGVVAQEDPALPSVPGASPAGILCTAAASVPGAREQIDSIDASLCPSAGALVGLQWDSAAREEWFVRIDPATGEKTNVAVIPDVYAVSMTAQPVDSVGGRYFFHGYNADGLHLFAIDVATGSVVASYPEAKAGYYQYDADRDVLVGVAQGAGWTEWNFQIFNLATGEAESVVAVDEITGISGGGIAMDDAGDRLFVQGRASDAPGTWIFTIDATSGEILSRVSSPNYVSELHYDASTDRIVGLWYNPADTSARWLVQIDPTTGSMTEVGEYTDMRGWYFASSSMNSAAGEYFIVTRVGESFVHRKMSTSTGEILAEWPETGAIAISHVVG